MRLVRRIHAIPAWAKILIAVVLYILLVREIVPMALRWPARILGVWSLGGWGFLQLLFEFKDQSGREILRRVIVHPCSYLVALVAVSIAVKEEYPFSHFPMYADPGPTGNYYFLGKADSEGETEPLPIRNFTRITSSKLGKIYRSKRSGYCREHNKRPDKLKPADKQEIGVEVLDYIAERAKSKGNEDVVQGVWRLVRVNIEVDEDGVLNEIPEILANRDFSHP
ncbi:MAG: hypothetical protein AAF585_09445 [Verrucomicrobiota bacterium]